jgi:hypothetical protein
MLAGRRVLDVLVGDGLDLGYELVEQLSRRALPASAQAGFDLVPDELDGR